MGLGFAGMGTSNHGKPSALLSLRRATQMKKAGPSLSLSFLGREVEVKKESQKLKL